MWSCTEILTALGFDPDEPVPIYYPASRNRNWQSLELASPLGLSAFGFGWDDDFWFYKASKIHHIDHHDSGFWRNREPDWSQVRSELRRVSDYNPANLLPLG